MSFQITAQMRIIPTFILFTLLCSTIFAQKSPMKWGKIPSQDIVMTTYEADPDAEAVILGHYAKIDVDRFRDYDTYYTYHIRIKILSKEGVDRASAKIPYLKTEKITDFQAQTINGGKITKVNRKNIFDEKVIDNYFNKNVAFPDVQVGSIIEYRYILQSPYISVLDNWYFQTDIPIRHSECIFTIPKYLEYVIVSNLDRKFDEKEEKGTKIGNFDATLYRFIMKNVDARKKEPFITTMRDYYNNIKFQLVTSMQPYGGGMLNKFMKDWPHLIQLWWEHEAGGKQIRNKLNHKKILKAAQATTSGITDPKEKAEALYRFIQNTYTWNKRFSDYIHENKLDHAYQKNTGNSAEINLSLLACLRDAGIEAHPIRLSTRKHGKIQKIYPIVQQFNHIAILAKIDGKTYLLDAISKNLIFNMLHPQSLNSEGLQMKFKDKSPEWIPLMPVKTDEIVNVELQFDNDEPTAKLTGVYTGYQALYRQSQYRAKDEEDYIEDRLGSFYDFEVDSTEFNNDKPERFAEVIHLKVNDAITASSDIIYINPLLMEQSEERIFSLKKRTYPVDIAYPYSERYILNFQIPEGYIVDTKPENIKLVLPDNSGEYTYLIDVKNNNLQLICKKSLKKAIYYPHEYEALKGFFDMIFDKEAEQIILKKK